jgi:hypothetical protein
VDGGVWRAYAKEKPGMKAKELKHVETCWNWWVVGQSALLVSSFVFRLSRHSDYNSKRVSMPTWIWRLYLSYFSRINSNSNVQCFIVKQLRCECLISYLNLVSSLFERPSHGATMRSIGPKSWWKARLSYAQQISKYLRSFRLFQTLQLLHVATRILRDPVARACEITMSLWHIVTYRDILQHITTCHILCFLPEIFHRNLWVALTRRQLSWILVWFEMGSWWHVLRERRIFFLHWNSQDWSRRDLVFKAGGQEELPLRFYGSSMFINVHHDTS